VLETRVVLVGKRFAWLAVVFATFYFFEPRFGRVKGGN
jgi:hypothetical protein